MTGSRYPSGSDYRATHSFFRLIRRLVTDAATLVRLEIGLLKIEVSAKLNGVVGHLSRIAIGSGVIVVGILAFAAFLIVGLGVLLGGAYWLAALLVALLLFGGGGGLVVLGARRIGEALEPPAQSIQALRETKEWVGEEIEGLRGGLSAGGDRQRSSGEDRSRAIEPAGPGPRAAVASGPKGGAAAGPLPLSVPIHKRVFHEISTDDVLGQAAKVAFYMFLSLPPGLMVLFGLTGIFGGEEVALYLTDRIQASLPGSAGDEDSAAALVVRFVDQVVNENAPGPLSIGLLLGLWSSSAVFAVTAEALNMAYDVEEDRAWYRRRFTAIGVMFAFVLLVLSGSVALIAGPQIAMVLPLGEAGVMAWRIAQWPLAFLLVVIAFFIVYYVLPNRDQSASILVLLKSAGIAAVLWLVATVGFRIYISNFGSYSESYGFVGAILVLLLWMYLTGIVLLVGGEIGSELERRAEA